ncbi:MAG: hypothetical protein KKF88_09300 [Alphaproteobacteria bacterium]|nr:hypothetical protein [Alphaproteobacteria bacterium]
MSGFRYTAAVLAAALVLIPAVTARAQSADTDRAPRFPGVYRYVGIMDGFHLLESCVERWTLWADGTLLLESGASVSRGRWSVDKDADDLDWLTVSEQVPNGERDCSGGVTPSDLEPIRHHVVVMNSGDFQICLVPRRLADGSSVQGPCLYALRREGDAPAKEGVSP